MKRYILYLLTLIFMQDVFAQATESLTGIQATINGLNYRLDEERREATLDNGNSWNGYLSLPSVVFYDGKDYPVTQISWLAFAHCETLTGINIPKSVREILHYAGYVACKNPFVGCINLKSIEVDEENEWMCSVDGVLFNKDKTWLYAYPAGAQRPSYHIPDGVTTIAGDAFAYNLSLQSVIMPNSVEKAYFGTFNGCRNLGTVRLSENLKYLGAYSFDSCESLRVIDIPEGVSSFAESVFRWTNLEALVIRGTFSKDLRSDTFYFVSKSMIIYAQPSEIPKFKKVFSGTVLPLDEYVNAIPKPTDYHPFVERGKLWKVHGFNMGSAHTITEYCFTEDQSFTIHDGREYVQMYYHNENDERGLLGELREEGQRVYRYDAERQTEYVLYDFSLKVGDTFHETRNDLTFIVERADQQVVNGDTLKTLHLSASFGRITADWVEGIGSIEAPLKNFYTYTPTSWNYRVAYVSGSRYWPLTFGLNWNGWWGTQLKTFGPEIYPQDANSLTYELVNDPTTDVCSLHVSGMQRLTCGKNHYINCIAEPTGDLMVKKLTFQIEDIEPLADCKGTYYVNYSFPFFNKYTTYIVTDERGEHIVPVRELAPYRPFIEEGKVWKVGWFPGLTNWARKLDYYYFEGDSIVGGQLCKRMFCRTEKVKEWANEGDALTSTEYRGAFYEEGKRVYCFFPGRDVPELMYDFESEIGDTITIHGGSCIIADKNVIQQNYFKGNSTSVAYCQQLMGSYPAIFYGYDFQHTILWAEGIGRFDSPLQNVYEYVNVGYYYELMQCTVGDEIIYKNNANLKDGVTPDEGDYTDGDVKKHWLDFTHTTKPRPKAPRKAENGESQMTNDESSADDVRLSGEYSDTKLYVSLSPLQGPYTITITDADNNSVYTHTVQTSSVVAINTDLSQYANGTYTICVENAEEAYTALLVKGLDVAVRDIPAINGKSVNGKSVNGKSVNGKSVNGKWYDLSGRRLSRRPSQGLYIENGQLRVATKHTSR